MADYHLKISSYAGILAWAVHYRGRVEGPRPRSCHGATVFHGSTGKTTCEEGHEMPRRREWDVDQEWTEEDYQSYGDSHFETDGPGQFTDQKTLIETAVKRFKGELPTRWWEEEPEVGGPGDRLILGSGLIGPEDIDDDTPKPDGIHPWGSILAEIPAVPGED